MEAAIRAAKLSGKRGDYAIGAVLVKGDKILATGYETLKSSNDPVNGHAEVDAIRKACKKLKKPYVEGCVLYSTHEPCPMCAASSIWAKVGTIVYGVTREDMINVMKRKANKKFAYRQIAISCKYITSREKPVSNVKLIPGFMRKECLELFDLVV